VHTVHNVVYLGVVQARFMPAAIVRHDYRLNTRLICKCCIVFVYTTAPGKTGFLTLTSVLKSIPHITSVIALSVLLMYCHVGRFVSIL